MGRSSILSLSAPLILAFGVAAEAAEASSRSSDAEAFFESRIRPLLAERCWGCHGPEKQKGNVRLDSRPALVAEVGAGPLVIPGAPAESRLIEVVGYDEEVKMPPKGKLPDRSIADLNRWIQMGAPWPESPRPAALSGDGAIAEARRSHWAFRPVRRHEAPTVRDKSWPSTPVDLFILAELERNGLTPSPPADRRTLIRRVTVDLLGVPPTPGEVETFIGDPEPDDLAFARLVDRLLASPQYGERWGRHWLDVARYADSKGYVYADREEERYPFSYSYRDYVIRAFNRDLPYDQFLLEQIAADCLPAGPEDDRSRLAALGFLTLGRRFVNNIHDIIDDRLDVIFRGTQGLTIGCARCHDHKFDPIPTRDYYSLYGVFASTTERTVRLDDSTPDNPARRLYASELDARQKALDRALEARRAELSRRLRDRVEEYLVAVPEADKLPGDEFYVILRDPNDLNPVFVHRWKSYLLRTQTGGEFHPIFGAWHSFAALGEKDFASKAPALAARFARDAAIGGPQQLNRKVAQAFQGPPPRSMSEVARRYAAVLLEVHKCWLDGLERAKKTGAPLPTVLSDTDAEAIRQVLYAPDSPTTVPPLKITEIEPFFDEKTRVELAQLQMKIDQWNLEATVAPPQALVLCEAANPVNPRVFRRGNPTMMGEAVPRQFLKALSTPDPRPFARGQRPSGAGSCDRESGQPVDGSRAGQPRLDAPLRCGSRAYSERLRDAWRVSKPPRAARRPGPAIRRGGMVDQDAAPADPALADLPADERRSPGRSRERSREPLAVADEPAPARLGVVARRDPGRLRPARHGPGGTTGPAHPPPVQHAADRLWVPRPPELPGPVPQFRRRQPRSAHTPAAYHDDPPAVPVPDEPPVHGGSGAGPRRASSGVQCRDRRAPRRDPSSLPAGVSATAHE